MAFYSMQSYLVGGRGGGGVMQPSQSCTPCDVTGSVTSPLSTPECPKIGQIDIMIGILPPPQALREHFGQVRKMRVTGESFVFRFTFLKVARKFAPPANLPGKGPAEEVDRHHF